MSYGFDLFHLPSGPDRDAALRRMVSGDNDAGEDNGPSDPAKEKAKENLAKELVSSYASLQPFQRNYAELAKELGIHEQEARRLYRHLELNDQEHTVQITLFDDTAGLSFSPEGSPSDCRSQLQHVWDCLKIIETRTALSTYDPQLGRVLDLAADFEPVLQQTCASVDDPGQPG